MPHSIDQHTHWLPTLSLHIQGRQHDSWWDNCISTQTHTHSPFYFWGRPAVPTQTTVSDPIVVYLVLLFLFHQLHSCCRCCCCCFCHYWWQSSRQDLVLDGRHSIGKDKWDRERQWDRSFTTEKERWHRISHRGCCCCLRHGQSSWIFLINHLEHLPSVETGNNIASEHIM